MLKTLVFVSMLFLGCRTPHFHDNAKVRKELASQLESASDFPKVNTDKVVKSSLDLLGDSAQLLSRRYYCVGQPNSSGTFPVLISERFHVTANYELTVHRIEYFEERENQPWVGSKEPYEPGLLQFPVQHTAQAFKSKCHKGYLKYKSVIERALQFALKEYQRRDWGADFSQKLIETAVFYRYFSTYLVVKPKRDQRIVASLRLIHAPFGYRRVTQKGSSNVLSEELGCWGENCRQRLGIWFDHECVIQRNFNFLADPLGLAMSLKLGMGVLTEQGRAVYPASQKHPLPLLPMEYFLGRIFPRKVLYFEQQNQKIDYKRCAGEFVEEQLPNQGLSANTDVFWGQGDVIEPGNLAVKRDLSRALILPALAYFARFLNQEVSDEGKQFNRLMYSYNDRPRLYTPYGFQHFGEPIEVVTGTKKTSWQPLVANPSDIAEGFSKMLKRFLSGDQNQFEAEMKHLGDWIEALQRGESESRFRRFMTP